MNVTVRVEQIQHSYERHMLAIVKSHFNKCFLQGCKGFISAETLIKPSFEGLRGCKNSNSYDSNIVSNGV